MEEWEWNGIKGSMTNGRKNISTFTPDQYDYLHLKQLTDSILMEGIRKGKVAAFDELFNRYWESLYAAAYARLRDQEEAKDCVQEIFFTLWEKREQFPVSDSISGYLFITLKNRIYNLYRSHQVREKYIRFQQGKENETEISPDEMLEYREFNKMIENEIQLLPEKMREIFILSRKHGLSIGEIAENLSLSPQTVKNQVSSALKRLRLKLDQYRK